MNYYIEHGLIKDAKSWAKRAGASYTERIWNPATKKFRYIYGKASTGARKVIGDITGTSHKRKAEALEANAKSYRANAAVAERSPSRVMNSKGKYINRNMSDRYLSSSRNATIAERDAKIEREKYDNSIAGRLEKAGNYIGKKADAIGKYANETISEISESSVVKKGKAMASSAADYMGKKASSIASDAGNALKKGKKAISNFFGWK